MMHVMFLGFVGLVIGSILWLEWPSLDHALTKAVYLTIVFSVFIISVVITLWPDTPGPLQGVRTLFRPLILPWMRK
ncbi:hypothetical protein H8B09_18520 [Paenibacillus sp. PR3]|uniref:Uncharacterized protein n=1 Tax=Paenibacillus terricola TaxID=2763503 RepID=A0ABR8N092_9BACL|nr:hypothetical protein [Paenibacillus terricola]MBD3920767.1 hypothetical protein [Paenibacillus terricola]